MLVLHQLGIDTSKYVGHVMQTQDGPLAGIYALQSTNGQYTVDSSQHDAV